MRFFAYVVVGKLGYSWEVGMGTIFWGSIGLFVLTLFQIRYWLMASIPLSLRVGIGAGIGFFIALIGFKKYGISCRESCNLSGIRQFYMILKFCSAY